MPLLRTLTALATCLALASPLSATPEDGKPDYYVVSDADSSITLFGTMHVLKPGLDWLKEEAKLAISGANHVYMELDMDAPDLQAVMQNSVFSNLAGAPGEQVQDKLEPLELAKLQSALSLIQLPADLTNQMSPGMAALFLVQAAIIEGGYDASSGVEGHFLNITAETGVDVVGLESPNEQLSVFFGAPIDEQTAFLKNSLRTFDESKASLDSLVAAWMGDDYVTMFKEFNTAQDAAPMMAEALLANRNKAWMDAFKGMLERNENAFVAVGALHLPGETGLLTLLEQAGYSVTRH